MHKTPLKHLLEKSIAHVLPYLLLAGGILLLIAFLAKKEIIGLIAVILLLLGLGFMAVSDKQAESL